MSKLLRHDPDTLEMDKEGWVSSESLIAYLGITADELIDIVTSNDKQRFVLSEDKSKIRAAQGHSKGVADDKEYTRLTQVQTDFDLYHGTDSTAADKIRQTELSPGKRQYVHWTRDLALATKRANQKALWNKAEPCLITLHVKHYLNGGGKLFVAENGVHLTPAVPGGQLEYTHPNNK